MQVIMIMASTEEVYKFTATLLFCLSDTKGSVQPNAKLMSPNQRYGRQTFLCVAEVALLLDDPLKADYTQWLFTTFSIKPQRSHKDKYESGTNGRSAVCNGA